MLKEGMEAVVITGTLKKKYIDPLLDTPKKKSENRTVDGRSTNERLNGMTDFTSYPQIPARIRKMKRTRRSLLFKKMIEGHSAPEHFFFYRFRSFCSKPAEMFHQLVNGIIRRSEAANQNHLRPDISWPSR
ncbi:MAG: hypothetical protein WDM78_11255 [Puia sp.]